MLRRTVLALLALAPAGLAAGCEPSMQRSSRRSPELDAAVLDAEIAAIAERAQPGVLEVAVQNLDGGEMWAWNGSKAFPMLSVFKAPLGAAVLAEVDARRLDLDETITLTEHDISPPLSAVADAWPGVSAYTAGDLLVRAVGESDNTAADVLMKRIGGPGAVTAWLRSKGIREISIDRYERELACEISGMASFRIAWKGWPAFKAARDEVSEADRRAAAARFLSDPRDTATAVGMLNFLRKLAIGGLLSKASTDRLLRIMSQTSTGPDRLRAGLPAGARLAHKTGTSATDVGLTAATNDVGIVTLKDGRRYAVVVFLAASPQDEPARDRTIADTMRVIAKAAR